MLDQILNITEQNLDQAQTQKQILNNDRMKPVLFSVLCEIKERSVLSLRNMQDQDPPNPDLMRLDNMLIAEQIVDGNPQDQTTIENAEYKKKLEQIQRIYKQEIEKHNQGMYGNGHCATLNSLLEEQTGINEQGWKKVPPCLVIY